MTIKTFLRAKRLAEFDTWVKDKAYNMNQKQTEQVEYFD
jgi:hypothetical protein